MRIVPEHRVIEIGHIVLGTALARTPAATEAIYLLARHAFDELGYRRLEWKCDALNAASRRAAERYGFRFEGVFREHMIIKGRNRDTAWFAILEEEWPPLRGAFEAWLDPANFDARRRAAAHARRDDRRAALKPRAAAAGRALRPGARSAPISRRSGRSASGDGTTRMYGSGCALTPSG